MGLFGRKPRNGVRGTARVVACTAHSGTATHQTCRMNLVVEVDGIPAYSIEHSQITPARKWPNPGDVLPVVVNRKDPSKLSVDFDEVPDQRDFARQRAEQHAAMLRGGGAQGSAMPGTAGLPGMPAGFQIEGTPQVTIVGGTAADIPPEMRAGLEQMLGVDLDGDGVIGGAGAAASAPHVAGGGGDDRLAQLERLARLHQSGALSDREFEAEKRRLLGA